MWVVRPSPLAATPGQSSSRSHLHARMGAGTTAAKPHPWPTCPVRERDSGHLLHPWPPSGVGRGTGHTQLHFCRRSEARFRSHRRKPGPGGPNYHPSSVVVWGLDPPSQNTGCFRWPISGKGRPFGPGRPHGGLACLPPTSS